MIMWTQFDHISHKQCMCIINVLLYSTVSLSLVLQLT